MSPVVVAVLVASRVNTLVLFLKMVHSSPCPFAHRCLAHWEIAVLTIVHHVIGEFDLLLSGL